MTALPSPPEKNRDSVVLGLSAVVISVIDRDPHVFIVRGAEHSLSEKTFSLDALPFGPFDPDHHPTLEKGVRQWIADQTPLSIGYIEQLYTFGSKERYADRGDEQRRVISVGYLALTHHPAVGDTNNNVFFGNIYRYFPWEDWRSGKPDMIEKKIVPALTAWADGIKDPVKKAEQQWRVQLCFGVGDVTWDDEKVLERYELIYESGLIMEFARDQNKKPHALSDDLGLAMQYDHRRILATAMGRLRGKIKYRPVVFELMPDEFTLLQLQQTVESLGGYTLHKQNFRRLVEGSGMVEEIAGKKSAVSGGRPASLFRFRRDVILERSAPGVRLSASPHT